MATLVPLGSVMVAVPELEIWLAEKLLVDSARPSMASATTWCSPSLKVPRLIRLVFFTGCWITAARPVSQAQPYLVVWSFHSTASYGAMPSIEAQPGWPARFSGLMPLNDTVPPGSLGPVPLVLMAVGSVDSANTVA